MTLVYKLNFSFDVLINDFFLNDVVIYWITGLGISFSLIFLTLCTFHTILHRKFELLSMSEN